jgi:hypothetical protein
MYAAFQPNAFQGNAFQIAYAIVAAPAATQAGSSKGRGGKSRRRTYKIEGRRYRVSESELEQLLLQTLQNAREPEEVVKAITAARTQPAAQAKPQPVLAVLDASEIVLPFPLERARRIEQEMRQQNERAAALARALIAQIELQVAQALERDDEEVLLLLA